MQTAARSMTVRVGGSSWTGPTDDGGPNGAWAGDEAAQARGAEWPAPVTCQAHGDKMHKEGRAGRAAPTNAVLAMASAGAVNVLVETVEACRNTGQVAGGSTRRAGYHRKSTAQCLDYRLQDRRAFMRGPFGFASTEEESRRAGSLRCSVGRFFAKHRAIVPKQLNTAAEGSSTPLFDKKGAASGSESRVKKKPSKLNPKSPSTTTKKVGYKA